MFKTLLNMNSTCFHKSSILRGCRGQLSGFSSVLHTDNCPLHPIVPSTLQLKSGIFNHKFNALIIPAPCHIIHTIIH